MTKQTDESTGKELWRRKFYPPSGEMWPISNDPKTRLQVIAILATEKIKKERRRLEILLRNFHLD